jgi:hypothetical protein
VILLILIIPFKIYVDKQSGIKAENKFEEFQNKINEIKKVIQENFTVNANECVYVTVYDTDGTTPKTNPTNQEGINAYNAMKLTVDGLVTTLVDLETDINAAFDPSVSSLLTPYNEGFLGNIEKVGDVLQTDTNGKYKRTTTGQIKPLLTKLNTWLGTKKCSDMCNSTSEIYNYKDNRCYCNYGDGYVENNYNSTGSLNSCINPSGSFTTLIETTETSINNLNLDSTATPTPILTAGTPT